MKSPRLLISMTLLAGIASGALVLNSCQYSFQSNINYAAYNESYQKKVREAGYIALTSDSRVKAVLSGPDGSSLQATLTGLNTLKDEVDAVVFAAAVHSLLIVESTTEETIAARLSAASRVIEAVKAFDDGTRLSSQINESGIGESARQAMETYASNATAETLNALVQAYASAVIPGLADSASAAPIGSALIYAASSEAVTGSNTIESMLENLAKDPAQAKTGDAETETQYSGSSLVAQLIIQAQSIVEASSAAGASSDLTLAFLKEWSQVITSATEGMVQLAAVISGRLLSSSLDSTSTAETVASLAGKVRDSLSAHASIAEKVRSVQSASTDEAEKSSLAGLLGRLTQLVSFISSKEEVEAAGSSLASLNEQLSESSLTLEKAKEYLTSTNGTLAASVSSDSAGGGSSGGCSTANHFVGYSTDSSNKAIPGYWLDGVWTGFDLKSDATGGRVTAVACKSGSLHFVGYQVVAGNVNEAGYWKNGSWTALPALASGKTCNPSDAATVGADLFIAASCRNAADKNTAGYWKNGTWTSLPNSSSEEISSTARITVAANKDVYIVGTLGSTNTEPGYWLNDTWTGLTTAGTGSGSRSATNLVLNGSSVIVSGNVPNGSNNFVAALWTDNVLTQQSFPAGKAFCNGRSALIDGTDLYQTGTCRDGNPIFQPFYWKNGTAVALPILDNTKSGEGMVIRKIGADIYIGGYSTNSSSVVIPGYWKNGDWTALPSLDTSKSSIVLNMGP